MNWRGKSGPIPAPSKGGRKSKGNPRNLEAKRGRRIEILRSMRNGSPLPCRHTTGDTHRARRNARRQTA